MEQANTLLYRENASRHLEKIGELLSPFSTLLDGEIIYESITDNKGNVFKRAQNFFGKSNEIVGQEDIDLFLERLSSAQKEISSLEESLLKDIKDKPILSGLYYTYFYDIERKISLLKNSVFIEASKGGFYISDKHIEPYINNTNNELDVFGSQVSEHPDEVKFIMDKCYEELLKEKKRNIAKKKLTGEEFLYLEKSLDYVSEKTDYKKNIDTGVKNIKPRSHKVVTEFDIPKNEQINAYHEMLNDEFQTNDIYSHNWKIIQDNNAKNASVDQNQEEIKLPGDQEPFVSISSLLGTYTHEIGKHVVSGYNTNKYLGRGFKGPNYLETEEGLASIFTALGDGRITHVKDLQQLVDTPTVGTICILIGELYNEKNTIAIMNIYKKLIGSNHNMETIVTRRKRFIHPNAIGSSAKDMAYTRGKNQVIYFLQSMTSSEELIKNIHELNTFKLALKDRHLIPLLKKELGIQEENLMKSNFIGLYISQQLGIALQDSHEDTIGFEGLVNNITKTSQNTAEDIIKNFTRDVI